LQKRELEEIKKHTFDAGEGMFAFFIRSLSGTFPSPKYFLNQSLEEVQLPFLGAHFLFHQKNRDLKISNQPHSGLRKSLELQG
jgi:hypothetical protein